MVTPKQRPEDADAIGQHVVDATERHLEEIQADTGQKIVVSSGDITGDGDPSGAHLAELLGIAARKLSAVPLRERATLDIVIVLDDEHLDAGYDGSPGAVSTVLFGARSLTIVPNEG